MGQKGYGWHSGGGACARVNLPSSHIVALRPCIFEGGWGLTFTAPRVPNKQEQHNTPSLSLHGPTGHGGFFRTDGELFLQSPTGSPNLSTGTKIMAVISPVCQLVHHPKKNITNPKGQIRPEPWVLLWGPVRHTGVPLYIICAPSLKYLY